MRVKLLYVLIIVGLESTFRSKPDVVLVGTLSLIFELH